MPVAPIERNHQSEPNAEAFIFGFEMPSAGGPATVIDWTVMKPTAACPSTGFRWLHFNRLADETREWLENFTDVDETVVASLLQSETRPRCVPHEDGLMINLRGINHNPGAEPEDMISVRIWATKNLLISTRSYRVKAIHELREEVAVDGATSTGELVVRLAAKLVDNINPIIEQLNEDCDEYEESLLKNGTRLSPATLAEFRQTILILRRYIQPQREAMEDLQKKGGIVIDHDDQVVLRETGDRITRIAEELDTIRERAAVLQDQAAGQRQEQLNGRLLALSIISALFLPLTFVTGLLGMNVQGIPYANEHWAFFGVVGCTGILGLCLLGFLKWRRWI
jgi:zinc transporter